MPRPTPYTPLVTQSDSGDMTGWDDCHPSSTAMAIFRATLGARRFTWREVRAAMAKRGVVDRPNRADPTTEEQNIRAALDIAPEIKAQIVAVPTWTQVKRNLVAGGGYVCLYWYAAAPDRYIEKHSGRGQYGHAVFVESDGTQALWYDPLRPKGSRPKAMSWEDLKRLAHWGLGPTNARRPVPTGWIVRPKK